ncbi:MAG: outer membrane lipoprotein carrier protein LolA [Candidatus Aminicenantales bacterium]
MRKFMRSCLVAALVFSFAATPAITQSAKDILDKMIDAQGGRDALAKVKDMTITGTMEMVQMGLSGSLTLYQKEPNKLRIDAEFMGMVITQAYDGENAWWVNPQTGTAEDMPEQMAADIRRQALGNDSLLHPEKYGITFTYKGKETLEDKEYHVLEQAFADGFKAALYVDPQTYLVYKTKARTTNQMGVEVDAETFMSDYKKVDGLMMAHSMRVLQDGEEAMTMTFTDVTINTGLEDSFFKKSE